MTSRSAILWLKIAIESQFLLGALMVAAGIPLVADIWAAALNLIVDPAAPVAPLTREARLLAVIGGGVLIAWAFFAWHITTTQIEAGDPRGARALTIGLMLWFCTDSAGSIVAGVPLNAAANLVYLALFLPPLIGLMRTSHTAVRA